MKNLKRLSLLVLLIVFTFSCAAGRGKNSITGKVESIEFGKDGYTAKIKTAKDVVYFATISIVNLGGPQKYKKLKEGDVVLLKGEIWKTDAEKHIKVQEIVLLK